MMRSRRGESWRVCIYLIKKHTCATNPEIAESLATWSYSTVAKISGGLSKQLAVNGVLRDLVKMLEDKYSFFKA